MGTHLALLSTSVLFAFLLASANALRRSSARFYPGFRVKESSRCSDDGLGAIQPGRFPSGRMTWWISLLQAIRDQDFRDLALEAQMLLQVFAAHVPIAGVQIELLPQRQATSLT